MSVIGTQGQSRTYLGTWTFRPAWKQTRLPCDRAWDRRWSGELRQCHNFALAVEKTKKRPCAQSTSRLEQRSMPSASSLMKRSALHVCSSRFDASTCLVPVCWTDERVFLLSSYITCHRLLSLCLLTDREVNLPGSKLVGIFTTHTDTCGLTCWLVASCSLLPVSVVPSASNVCVFFLRLVTVLSWHLQLSLFPGLFVAPS